MTQQTFVFANAPTTLIPRLEAVLREQLTIHDGHHVATIADVVILRMARATDAVALALHACDALAVDVVRSVRVGVDTGTAVRDGDRWGGPVVELAARLAEHADPGEVLATSATRQATDRGQLEFLDLGERRLHGDGPPTALHRAYRVTDIDGPPRATNAVPHRPGALTGATATAPPPHQ